MVLNFLLTFFLPWIFGVRLYKRDKKSILLLAPFGAVVSFTIDVIGQAKFWNFKPVYKTKLFSSLPCHLGAYPVSAGYFFHYIQKDNINKGVLILTFSILLTTLELFLIKIRRVRYRNGWSIYWTLLSYILAYILCFLYYEKLRKLKLLV